MCDQLARAEVQHDEEGSPLAARSGVAPLRSYADTSKSTTPMGSPKSELEDRYAAAPDQVVNADLEQVQAKSHFKDGSDENKEAALDEVPKEAVRAEEGSQDGFKIE